MNIDNCDFFNYAKWFFFHIERVARSRDIGGRYIFNTPCGQIIITICRAMPDAIYIYRPYMYIYILSIHCVDISTYYCTHTPLNIVEMRPALAQGSDDIANTLSGPTPSRWLRSESPLGCLNRVMGVNGLLVHININLAYTHNAKVKATGVCLICLIYCL